MTSDRSRPAPHDGSTDEVEVSVIIPTFQRRDLVVRAVSRLSELRTDPARYEVIVVVDGSTDGSAEALRQPSTPMRLVVVEQPNRGRPAALNAGAAAASGEVLLFLDDDMSADPSLLDEHLRSYRELQADAVLGSLAHDPGSPDSVLSEEVRRWIDQDFEASRGVHEVVDPSRPRFVGGQFSVRRAVFERIGGFDSAFNRGRGFGNADFDLDLRLREAGARVVFNGDAVSTQTYVHEFRGVWRIFELMGRSDVAFDRKHPNRGRPQTRSLPPPATRKGRIARETLRHPYLTSALARPLAGVAGPLVDGGSRSRLTRGLGYVTLTHRYWYGVAMEGGGSGAGVRGPKPALAVLCYHRLTPPPLPRQLPWTTAPAELVRQVRAAVDDGWQLITPDEAAEFLRGGGAIPLRSMLITFDDGYADLADRGVAVLEDLGARALAFLVTGKLGARADWGDDPGPVPSPLLDVEQVLELAGRGTFEFGAHGRTHVAMPGLAAERLGAEVLEARTDLEAVGLPTPRFLAYPFGEFDAAARRAAAPYLGAFTTRDGLVRPDADWTRLPRVEVLAGTTPSQLVRRLRRLVFEAGARDAGGRARWAAGRALRRLAR